MADTSDSVTCAAAGVEQVPGSTQKGHGEQENKAGECDDEPTFTRKQVAAEAGQERVLIIINNAVYDVTEFSREHPGGSDILMEFVGRDATMEFEALGHSSQALRMMAAHRVGQLAAKDVIVV